MRSCAQSPRGRERQRLEAEEGDWGGDTGSGGDDSSGTEDGNYPSCTGNVQFAVTPHELWDALTADCFALQTKKRDEAQRRIAVKLPKAAGVPSAVATLSVENAPGGDSLLHYEFRPSIWAATAEETAAEQGTAYLALEAQLTIERLAGVVGQPISPSPAHQPGIPVAATAAQSTPTDDPIERIRKLAHLRDAGILTEEEFTAKKAEILSRM